MEIAVQLVGALLVLVPFVLLQLGKMTSGMRSYLALNVVGSSILAIDAGLTQQWGFLLLEGIWALVAVLSLRRRTATDRPPR